ncbi:TPA: AlpA family transcriptional regulator [Klebsiella pneumoniae]|nr:AlpA family transcriptional regulator [Klebsiella pneumoniae]KAB1557837.1 AlpA family transcriptional regulator [Klebsiella pneumoniae]MBD1361905.1 AlpA family transcriptional regulator [Klebsiella pneumoniae]OWR62117.1 Rha family transcriptional regulator [Klebsiella pneumoniae]QJI56437.1 AlpA family transcriptional regulator [Klebsiella pneumoniae]
MTIKPSLYEDQFVNMAFITHLTGLTDKWFYKLIKDGEFPTPIKFGRSSRWRQSEVEAWLQARIDASRGENSAMTMTHKLTVTPVEALS